MNRRLLSVRIVIVLGLLSLTGVPASAQAPAQPPPDLLIKGGRVIDPRNNVDAVLDVAVSGGKVTRSPPTSSRPQACGSSTRPGSTWCPA